MSLATWAAEAAAAAPGRHRGQCGQADHPLDATDLLLFALPASLYVVVNNIKVRAPCPPIPPCPSWLPAHAQLVFGCVADLLHACCSPMCPADACVCCLPRRPVPDLGARRSRAAFGALERQDRQRRGELAALAAPFPCRSVHCYHCCALLKKGPRCVLQLLLRLVFNKKLLGRQWSGPTSAAARPPLLPPSAAAAQSSDGKKTPDGRALKSAFHCSDSWGPGCVAGRLWGCWSAGQHWRRFRSGIGGHAEALAGRRWRGCY